MAKNYHDPWNARFLELAGKSMETSTVEINGKKWTKQEFIDSHPFIYKNAAESLWVYKYSRSEMGLEHYKAVQTEISTARELKNKKNKHKAKLMRKR